MICSSFNATTGQYDYFETATTFAFNADLPVPKLPPMAGKVGVPSIDAARPKPADAKYVGSGWFPKGMIVSSGSQRQGLKGLGDLDMGGVGTFFVIAGLLGVATWGIIAWATVSVVKSATKNPNSRRSKRRRRRLG